MKRIDALHSCMDHCTPAQMLEMGLYLVSFAKFTSASGPAEDDATHEIATAIMDAAGGERSATPTPFRDTLEKLDDFMSDDIPLAEL